MYEVRKRQYIGRTLPPDAQRRLNRTTRNLHIGFSVWMERLWTWRMCCATCAYKHIHLTCITSHNTCTVTTNSLLIYDGFSIRNITQFSWHFAGFPNRFDVDFAIERRSLTIYFLFDSYFWFQDHLIMF